MMGYIIVTDLRVSLLQIIINEEIDENELHRALLGATKKPKGPNSASGAPGALSIIVLYA